MAQMSAEAKAERVRLAKQYREENEALTERVLRRLTGSEQAFLCGAYNSPKYEATVNAMAAALREPGITPSSYMRAHMPFLAESVFTPEVYATVERLVDGVRDYPYSLSYTRRSFRSVSYAPYAERIASVIRAMFQYTLRGNDPASLVLCELSPEAKAYFAECTWQTGYCAYQVTDALDRHDPAMEAAVRRILTEANSSSLMTHDLIRGILSSHRAEFHALLGELLLAARLQEGLRQSICECADSGTKEAFLCLLRVIEENNLIRYSSVKRAVGCWLGLLSDEVRDLERVSDKSLALMRRYLSEPAAREEALSGEDAMEIYVALWSMAFDSVEAATDRITAMVEAGTHHQLLVAGYFINMIEEPRLSSCLALRVLDTYRDADDLWAVWMSALLPNRGYRLYMMNRRGQPLDLYVYFESRDEAMRLAALMEEKLVAFKGKIKTFSPCIFPWYEAKLARSTLAEIFCFLAATLSDRDLGDRACTLIQDCSADMRGSLFEALLKDPRTAIQRRAIIEGLCDRETNTRAYAAKKIAKMDLTAEEYRLLEPYLRFKAADIRTAVTALLVRQADTALAATLDRLLSDSREEVRLGALDMLNTLRGDPARSPLAEAFLPRLRARAAMADVSSKESILLGELIPAEVEENAEAMDVLCTPADCYDPDTPVEGAGDFVKQAVSAFVRYFPSSELPALLGGKADPAKVTAFLRALGGKLFSKDACAEAVEAGNVLLSLATCVEAHRMTPVRSRFGSEELLGEITHGFYYNRQEPTPGGEWLPGQAIWDAWAKETGLTNAQLLHAYILLMGSSDDTPLQTAIAPMLCKLYGPGFAGGISLPYPHIIRQVLEYFFDRFPADDRELLGAAVGLWFLRCVPDEEVMLHSPHKTYRQAKHDEMAHLLAHEQLYCLFGGLACRDAGRLPYTFPIAVAVAERCIKAYQNLPHDKDEQRGYIVYGRREYTRYLRGGGHDIHVLKELVGIGIYIRALFAGIITEAQFFEFALRRDVLPSALNLLSILATSEGGQVHTTTATTRRAWMLSQYRRTIQCFIGHSGDLTDKDEALLALGKHLAARLLPVVLDAEYKRGDSPAAYSFAIGCITCVQGVTDFARILESLGTSTINRGSTWSVSMGGETVPSRDNNLCNLLASSVPAAGETAEDLKNALQGKKITEKRLIEAALYAPDWIPLVGEYLGEPAFESVCYYFIAHMNEKFDDKRRALIARYTPLGEEELSLGAFDRAWFESAYAAIGEKKFDLVYAAAKYITEGAKHARARKYADACLGRMTVEETEATIADKRNKDLLMAYALIPSEGEDDMCRRYLFITKFRKESRKFGSQRAASEAKAAEMALTNLAQTAGYSDPMRLTLSMETKLIDDSRDLLRPVTVEDVTLTLTVGEDGKADISVEKGGKALKSLPAKLKKNETVLALTEFKKTLTEQYRRTRLMLEEAMETSVAFTWQELVSLLNHPVVRPMLEKLVLATDTLCGLPTPEGLTDAGGVVHPLDPTASVVIAHPHTLHVRGVWRLWQTRLFDRRLVQPFRQVFRELYIKTADERGELHSLRYAGHQLQPAKTVATLKGRRWVADVEEGLQKVYYRENIVAHIYALADWFSPADIEAPTLEWVSFTNRRTGEALKIDAIPDILFSEVMRDVDLAVSVAHVGGVDPEASHATVELRGAILACILPLFGLSHVRIENKRAVIEGKLATYTVHLGSGTVHQLGGAMIPVLPVHSQHRGRVFLPFADDDPKTAEIVSKILLFADDKHIQDPSILACIVRED